MRRSRDEQTNRGEPRQFVRLIPLASDTQHTHTRVCASWLWRPSDFENQLCSLPDSTFGNIKLGVSNQQRCECFALQKPAGFTHQSIFVCFFSGSGAESCLTACHHCLYDVYVYACACIYIDTHDKGFT